MVIGALTGAAAVGVAVVAHYDLAGSRAAVPAHTTAVAAGPAQTATVSLARLVGQTIVVRMVGRTPSASLLARVRGGQIGGVVLFSDNIGPPGPAHLIAALQAAARSGGNPPLLIAVDQEGGTVKRLPGPPTIGAPAMRTPAIARAQGIATGRSLANDAVNVDLAPVLDVAHGGFIAPRTFGSTPQTVAARGVAFAQGLRSGGVVATGKHFPGLGYAAISTDQAPVVIHASTTKLLQDLAPFRAAIAAKIPLIMVSTAVYPALGSALPAALSPQIVSRVLVGSLGFRGVVISDALATPAITHVAPVPTAAVAAINAGVDMVLVTTLSPAGADATSERAYDGVLAAAEHGRIARTRLTAAYARITALKATLLGSWTGSG